MSHAGLQWRAVVLRRADSLRRTSAASELSGAARRHAAADDSLRTPEAARDEPAETGLKPASYTDSALVSNSGNATSRATVIVKLPTDARLFADARQLSLTGSERKFVSPQLPSGQEFTYRFRAEYERDGETVSVTKKVPVRDGGTVTVEFADLTAKVAQEKPDKQEKPERNAGIGGGAVAAIPTSNPVSKSDAPPAVTPVAPVRENAVANVRSPSATRRRPAPVSARLGTPGQPLERVGGQLSTLPAGRPRVLVSDEG